MPIELFYFMLSKNSPLSILRFQIFMQHKAIKILLKIINKKIFTTLFSFKKQIVRHSNIINLLFFQFDHFVNFYIDLVKK